MEGDCNMKELRELLGLTQKDFASKFGFNLRTLQQWEQGRSSTPVYLIPLVKRVIELESENAKLNKIKKRKEQS